MKVRIIDVLSGSVQALSGDLLVYAYRELPEATKKIAVSGGVDLRSYVMHSTKWRDLSDFPSGIAVMVKAEDDELWWLSVVL